MQRKRTVSFVVAMCMLCLIVVGSGAAWAGGDKVKMSFTDAPVGLILQALGKLTGKSFTISSQAASKMVSIEMNDVPFDEALEMIAQAGGVVISKTGTNRYVVYSKEETGDGVKTEKQQEIEATEEFLSNSVMAVIPVKYVSVEDVENAINSTMGIGDSNRVVKVTKLENGDDRSFRSIVVYAASQRILDMIKKVVAQVDTPKPMVEIEVLFAEVSLNNNKNAGLSWNPMVNPITFTENNEGLGVFTLGSFTRSAISMEAALTMTFGKNNAKVLSCPKLRTMSGYKAVFKSETEQPIPEKDDDGNWSVTWKDIGISLEVLPVVMEDGTIQMSVHPKASNITSFITQGDITAPVISKRETETQVFLQPGEIMIISGLINDTEIKNLSKVPILGDIPLLGELFKSHERKKERSNVIVMLRPKLVNADRANSTVNIDKKIEQWRKQSLVSGQGVSKQEEKPTQHVDVEEILNTWRQGFDKKPVQQADKPVEKPVQQVSEPQEPKKVEQDVKQNNVPQVQSGSELDKRWQELVSQYKDKPYKPKNVQQKTETEDTNTIKDTASTDTEKQEDNMQNRQNNADQNTDQNNDQQNSKENSNDSNEGGANTSSDTSNTWIPPLE